MFQGCRFLFIITGHNTGAYMGRLLDSLADQIPSADSPWTWRAVFVDDASIDDTLALLEAGIEARGFESRFTVISNSERKYKTENVYRVLTDLADRDEIVVMLDADDCLADPRALEILAHEYASGWDVVWSNWTGSDGSTGKSDFLNPFASPRHQPFVSQHLFSFRKRLFDEISKSDLQDDEGNWFRAGCDAAIAWPVLERTWRFRFVDEPLYRYTNDNPLSHKPSGGKRDQLETLAILRNRSRPRRPRDWRFVLSHGGYFLEALLRSTVRGPRNRRHEQRIREVLGGAESIR